MGLIQDLHERKFTGCRGCDAIRKGLYKGLDLWKPERNIQLSTKFDSFDASPLGAFIESPLKARGGGTVSNLADILIKHNQTFTTNWDVDWTEFGDQVTEITTASSTHTTKIYESGVLKVSFVNTAGAHLESADPFNICQSSETVANPDGITHVTDNTTSGPATDIGTTGISLTYIRDSDGLVVRSFDNLVLCSTFFGATNWWWFKPA